ncbi:MAG: hypothetical protein J5J06_08450 [Phycisphaerae bacterium]|nr:hypothetical protein [Phycisphaerae bacterium]
MLTSGVFGFLADYLLWWVLFLSIVIHTWCFFQYYPIRKRTRRGLVLGNILVFFCLSGAVFLVGESYFRFLAVYTDSFGLSLPARRWFALYTRLNRQGCRDEEWTVPKPPDVYRIAFVGDSFTYGWGIEDEADRFPEKIEKRLNESYPGPFEVLNAARPGWDTGDELRHLRELISTFGVDEVVLCYVPNDIEDLIPTTDDFNPREPPPQGFFDPDRSPFYEYLYTRVWLPRRPTVRLYQSWLAQGYADPAIRSAQDARLAEFVSECVEGGIVLRVALLPFLRVGPDSVDQARLFAELEQFFTQRGVSVVDLLRQTEGVDPQELTVSAIDPHPNEKAHALFAQEIWKAFYANTP